MTCYVGQARSGKLSSGSGGNLGRSGRAGAGTGLG